MITYTYSIEIINLDTRNTVETATGIVQAERYSHACTAAWPLITERCDQYRAQGQGVGVGDLHVKAVQICRGCDMPAASVNHAIGVHYCKACA